MTQPVTYCIDYLREDGADVYPALLFLPEDKRNAIAALHAFHNEIGKISYLVSEPLPGEIRLQWWREVVQHGKDTDRKGEAEANPLAKSLLDVISQYELPRDGFERYLEARTFDLYNDAMPDQTTLEAYLGETESFILQMASMVCGMKQNSTLADACGHGGVAIGLVRRLKLLSRDRVLQKTYLPENLLASAGLTREEWLATASHQHEMAVLAVIALAREHFHKAIKAIRKMPKADQAVFLPVVLARSDLNAIGESGRRIRSLLDGTFVFSPMRRQLGLWKTALTGF